MTTDEVRASASDRCCLDFRVAARTPIYALIAFIFACLTACTDLDNRVSSEGRSAATPVGKEVAWWQRAVMYEIYVRSFKDSNGDGTGDLTGIASRLDYLANLGVDAIWITPFYPSPQVDFGYDVSGYTDVDPQFGTLGDFDRLVEEAHGQGIKVIIDLVLNHTSDRHPWFLASRSSRESPYRDWYVWRDAVNGGPPNRWASIFEPSAWTLDVKSDQYYYHAFYSAQPDLNWRNPAVEKAMFKCVRFWLERGVDGLRLDAFPTLFEDPLLRDEEPVDSSDGDERWYERFRYQHSMFPETYGVLRRLRQLSDSYARQVLLIPEAYLPTMADLAALYGDQDDLAQLPFNFFLANVDSLNAGAFRRVVSETESVLQGRWTTYVLGNHDLPRAIDRYGNPENDLKVAKLLATMLLTLRGTPFLYYGEEVGMVTTLPRTIDEVRDPIGRTGWPEEKGRDGERTPMQWTPDLHSGFSSANPWLRIPPSAIQRNVLSQGDDPHSVLNYYKRAIALRRQSAALQVGKYAPIGDHPGVFAYLRTTARQTMVVGLNMSSERVVLPLSQVGLEREGKLHVSLSSSGREGTSVASHQLVLDPFEALVGEYERGQDL